MVDKTYSFKNIWWIVGLFIYYLVLVLMGICIVFFKTSTMITKFSEPQVMHLTLCISLAFSLIFSSLSYIRKLYLICLREKIDFKSDFDTHVVGNFAYLFFRPLFAIAFSILLVYTLRSGLLAILDDSQQELNGKFVYVSATLSSMLSYSVGKFMDNFSKLSEEKIMNTMGSKGERDGS